MKSHDHDELTEKEVKGLVKRIPRVKPDEAMRTEFIGRLYKVSEERKSIVEFITAGRVAVGAVLVVLIAAFTYLFSPIYPTVANISGTVKIYRASRNEWVFAEKSRVSLRKNDILKTFSDGQADLVMAKVCHIRLKSDSEMKLTKAPSRILAKEIGYELSKGKVFAHYNKHRTVSKELGIETPQALATAIGTDFMVESTPVLNQTLVGVLDGAVRVASLEPFALPKTATTPVLVKAGERTVVHRGEQPSRPARLEEDELIQMQELYNIGTNPQVALLISTGSNRARELLALTPLYISSDKSGPLPEKFKIITATINQAIKEGSKEKHLESIKELKEFIDNHPNPKYDVQLLLFIGAYYKHIAQYEDAIAIFERVIRDYPRSGFASMAQCAIGIIYEEQLKDFARAKLAYQKVLSNYPRSPETEEASAGLSRLTK